MKITCFEELDVYKVSFRAAMKIFNLSKEFLKEEKYSLTDQIRRSSRSVCANIAEAYHKRKYPKHFVLKLSDAESEAAETLSWIYIAKACNYIEPRQAQQLIITYKNILGKLIKISTQPEKWKL